MKLSAVKPGLKQMLHLSGNDYRNILQKIKKRKVNWLGHILRTNCIPKHFIKGKNRRKVSYEGRRGRRRKQLLNDFRKTREYWKLKEKSLDRTLWSTRFGRGYEPAIR